MAGRWVSPQIAGFPWANQARRATVETAPKCGARTGRLPDVWRSVMGRIATVLRGVDRGMTTAEYAVGTVAACGFGGVLYKLLTSDTVVKMLTDVIKRAFALVT